MDQYIVIAMAAMAVATATTVVAIVVGGALRNYFEIKRDEVKAMMQPKPIEPKDTLKYASDKVKYSNDVLDLVLKIIAQESVLYFREFTDTHKIEKVTLAQVKNMVSDVVNAVNGAINRAGIDFSMTIFTVKFYDHYITHTTMDYIKQLLAKYVIEVVG